MFWKKWYHTACTSCHTPIDISQEEASGGAFRCPNCDVANAVSKDIIEAVLCHERELSRASDLKLKRKVGLKIEKHKRAEQKTKRREAKKAINAVRAEQKALDRATCDHCSFVGEPVALAVPRRSWFAFGPLWFVLLFGLAASASRVQYVCPSCGGGAFSKWNLSDAGATRRVGLGCLGLVVIFVVFSLGFPFILDATHWQEKFDKRKYQQQQAAAQQEKVEHRKAALARLHANPYAFDVEKTLFGCPVCDEPLTVYGERYVNRTNNRSYYYCAKCLYNRDKITGRLK